MQQSSKCPECGKSNLYSSVPVSAGGGHAPNYLPGLGTVFFAAKFTLVVCKDCGLTRFFADSEGLSKISNTEKWRRI